MVLMTPFEFLKTRAETSEITTASGASIRLRAESQLERHAGRRMVIGGAPGGQLLAIAAWTASIPPRSFLQHAGFPSMAADTAAQRVNPEQHFYIFGEGSPRCDARITRSAFGARKLHEAKRKPALYGCLIAFAGLSNREYTFSTPRLKLHKPFSRL